MQQKKALITVVVPVFNREKIVVRLLESISKQSLKEFKLILVDNNSSDGTAKVLKEWASEASMDVQVLSCSTPGAAAARQCGLDEVDTPWILFFDSDDVMLPMHMSRVIEGIKDNPSADILGWDVTFDRQRKRPFYTKSLQYRSLFNGSMATQRYCARTELFRRAGGWNVNTKVWDDIELGARLLAQNPKIVKLAGSPTVEVFSSEDSITNIETSGDICYIDYTLNCISKTLGEKGKKWTDAKKMAIVAKRKDAALLGPQIIAKSQKKILLSFIYHYVKSGLPGISHIIKPFM